MSRTMLRLAVLALLLSPVSAFALGLGEIHVNSALNEPLNAEIELVSATPDELSSVSAALASRDTFTRYGLDRPIFLSGLMFRVQRAADGRAVLLVRSNEAISEPFVTFLVEVNWARGHLLREYTILLDPPVFTPGETERAAAPVAAPEAGEAPSSRAGSVQRAPEPTPAATPQESSAATAVSPGAATYQVRRNDTLFDISRNVRPGSLREVNRTMMALYRANPEAFEGNINRLRAGAILRIPDGGQIESLSADEAAAAVASQYSEWRASGGGTSSPHLRLVTPSEGSEAGGASAGGPSGSEASTEAANLRDKIKGLEDQLDQQRRLLDVKDADLARLQQQLAAQQQAAAQAGATTAPTPAPTPTPAPAEPTTATAPVEAPTTAPAEPTPTEAQPSEAPTPPAETTPAPAAESKSFLDSIKEFVQPWMLIAVVAVLLLLVVVRVLARRRRAPDLDETLGRLAAVSPETTAKFRNLREDDDQADSFLVEESGERPSAPMVAEIRAERSRPEAVTKPLTDDTISSETAINLDQGDPLAEADFHMAYGLYDQAADLVRIAIERHPERRDLKLKLLEIFFVWGNKDAFLQQARELHETRAQAPSSEWDKIVIMGKQICPDDDLFLQSRAGHAAVAQEVDLNLEGGENRVDVDLLAAPEDGKGGGIDLDLGGDSTSATGESPAFSSDGLDFNIGATSSTREMPVPTMESPTIESTAFDAPTVEQETVQMQPHDVPTVETPALRREGTVREKIDSAIFRQGHDAPADQTAELALDDLGLDLSSLPTGDTGTIEALDEETDHPADAPTMVAGLDEASRKLLDEAAGRGRDPHRTVETASLDDPISRDGGTGTWVLGDDTDQPSSSRANGADSNATMRVGAPDAAGRTATQRTLKMGAVDENLDMDLDRLSAALSGDTQRQPKPSGTAEERFSTDVFTDTSTGATSSRYKLDLDVGEVAGNRDRDREPTATERLPAEDLALPELEPVTMSEVGTKLDLARAYMDMGDPEGARSILEEVLTEGSASQKQEAQRLIASLPG
ncbi:MAG TPA: FimV/HubP family polar landmark protein [Steroidobacteraceae bacterium]|nr:FimV/HubP family polar landmark protein [Steroidobacteraceae bacterium]